MSRVNWLTWSAVRITGAPAEGGTRRISVAPLPGFDRWLNKTSTPGRLAAVHMKVPNATVGSEGGGNGTNLLPKAVCSAFDRFDEAAWVMLEARQTACAAAPSSTFDAES